MVVADDDSRGGDCFRCSRPSNDHDVSRRLSALASRLSVAERVLAHWTIPAMEPPFPATAAMDVDLNPSLQGGVTASVGGRGSAQGYAKGTLASTTLDGRQIDP